MNRSILPNGTQIAAALPQSAQSGTFPPETTTTLANLLDRLAGTKQPRMLRTTASLLCSCLGKSAEEITIDLIYEDRDRFRSYLKGRRNTENSIRTYVNHARILLKEAARLGWKPYRVIPEAWLPVYQLAEQRNCRGLVRFLMRTRLRPSDVTVDDVDGWILLQDHEGRHHSNSVAKRKRFWRILRETNSTTQTPKCLLREQGYGIGLDEFPSQLSRDVVGLLKWKQALFSIDRPKGQRHRPVTAKRLKHVICGLFGFAVNILGVTDIDRLSGLIKKEIVSAYIEWCLNERGVQGHTLQQNLRLIPGAIRNHPEFRSISIDWFKPLLDSVPVEDLDELRRRKALKYVEYCVAENISATIHEERARSRDPDSAVMEELLMKWLVTLPWRQKNIRECRITGASPNLVKSRMTPFSDIERPEWVKQEEMKNPNAEFWQFRFSPEETKTKRSVAALLPHQLTKLLEEYLEHYRPRLLRVGDPETLFVNREGQPLTLVQMTVAVSRLTIKYARRRVTPHLFRDIVAYTWLKDHPQDYLRLSKMLWHANINETIRTYGSRFNESSGVCAMEAWLDEREAKSK